MDTELVRTLLYFVSGGFLLFLAMTVIRDNITNRLNRVVAAMLFWAGLGGVALAVELVMSDPAAGGADLASSTLYRLHYLWEFLFPSLVVFSWQFPVNRSEDFRHRNIRYLVFIPQLVHVLLVLFFADVDGLLESLTSAETQEGFSGAIVRPFAYLLRLVLLFIGFLLTYQDGIFGTINLLYVIVAFYFLESGRRLLRNPRLIPQTDALLWSLRVGVGLFIVGRFGGLLLPETFLPPVRDIMFLGGLLIGSGFFTYAVIRHQFLDVRLVFRQSLVYTVTSAILVGLYIMLGVQAADLTRPVFGDRAEIVGYVFIILLLLLFQPISSGMDRMIQSMFMRTRSDHRNIIERFSREVISVFDPSKLRRSIEETMKTSMLVERVLFVLFDDSVGEYAVMPSDDFHRRQIIAREDMMLRGINLLDRPTPLGALSTYRRDSKLGELLFDTDVKMILPLKDTEHLLGFLALTNKVAGYRYSPEDYNLLGVLSNQMVTALTNARLYADSLERIRLEEEVTMARQIQLDLLPSEPPQLTTAKICAHSTPSRTVGGDFYDFVSVDGDNKIGIVIADASGKGMPAALMIAQIQAIIHSEVNNGNPISMMLKNMNRLVALSTSSEKYVTLFYGELDCSTRTFNYSNAGHNYPVLVRSDGTIELLQTGGTVIGAFEHMEFPAASVQLNDDDLLFLFTDGLSEAMDSGGVEYSEQRVRTFLREHRTLQPEEIMNSILDDVRTYDPSSPPQDDTTIVALKIACGKTGAPE